MDKTPRYILMSEKAIKIQEALKDVFDFRFQGYCTKHRCLLTEGYDGSVDCKVYGEWLSSQKGLPDDKEYKKHSCLYRHWIGLPYQDQLQEMLGENQIARLSLFSEWIVETLEPVGIYASDEFESLEQLWLVFVMKEKYNKIWKDNKWLKYF